MHPGFGLPKRSVRALALTCCLALVAATSAQALPSEAAELLARAQSAASSAVLTYEQHFPDQPEWRTALDLGRRAAQLAPDHPAPQRFLAQSYGTVQWHIRAWDAWQAYIALGGTVDAQAATRLVATARALGVSTFDAGRRAEALPYLEAIVRYAPGDLAASARLAQWHSERGEHDQAIPYLSALDAAGEAFDGFAEDVRRRARHGDVAVDAVAAAGAALAAGDTAQALTRYRDAVAAAPDFDEAWRAIGDVTLALGRYSDAVAAYETALALRPDDQAARAGLDRAVEAQAALAAPPPVAAAPAAPAPVPPADPPAAPAAPPAPEAPTPAPAPEPAPPPPPPPAPAAGVADAVALNTQVVHRAASAGGTGAFTFVSAPALSRDLRGYVGGTLHVRVEVLDAPSDAPVRYQVCLVPVDIAVAPACTDAARLVLGSHGTFESVQPLAALSGSGRIDWGRGITSVMLIVRDEAGDPVDERSIVADGERRVTDLDRYYPRTVRVQAVLVAPGSSFGGWP